MILFSRKIKCAHCNKNFKAKKERGNRVYVCSTYDNYGKCRREVIHQDELIYLLRKRYGEDFEITKENIESTVDEIIVKDKWVFEIKLKNDKPIIFGENFIQF